MNLSQYKDTNVLVTGGSGFFASHLTHRLLREGARVSVLTKYNSVIDNIRLVSSWDQLNILEGDLRNTDSMTQVKELAPEYIFHFAAYNHVGDSFLHIEESLQSNLVGTAHLMNAYSGYKNFIYIATSEVYGHQTEVPFTESMTPFPTSPYSIGKYAGELFAQMQNHVYQYPISILRPFNCFGPYQSPRAIIAEMIIKCLKGEEILSTEGKQTRDFNYVDNLVDGVLMAGLSAEAIGQVMNIGSGEEITIRDLILKVHELTDSKSELKLGALENRPTEIWRMQADNKKAQDILNWKPQVSFEEGLKKTVEWYRRFVDLYFNEDSPLHRL